MLQSAVWLLRRRVALRWSKGRCRRCRCRHVFLDGLGIYHSSTHTRYLGFFSKGGLQDSRGGCRAISTRRLCPRRIQDLVHPSMVVTQCELLGCLHWTRLRGDTIDGSCREYASKGRLGVSSCRGWRDRAGWSSRHVWHGEGWGSGELDAEIW
jgi:hypothetical protein